MDHIQPILRSIHMDHMFVLFKVDNQIFLQPPSRDKIASLLIFKKYPFLSVVGFHFIIEK